MALRPEAFQECFRGWIAHAIRTDDNGPDRLVAIDGKTCRGSHDAAPGSARCTSSAPGPVRRGSPWDRSPPRRSPTRSRRSLGSWRRIDLTDTVVTIDAMGCQKEIARTIVNGGGDFVISVKDNQPTLREAIEAYFARHLERDLADLRYRSHETSEAAHGRIDERSYFLTKVPADFALKEEWPWIKAIGYALRVTRHANGHETDETRYYILSRYLSGKRSARQCAVIGVSSRCTGCWT